MISVDTRYQTTKVILFVKFQGIERKQIDPEERGKINFCPCEH
jgi:hypothetical protein